LFVYIFICFFFLCFFSGVYKAEVVAIKVLERDKGQKMEEFQHEVKVLRFIFFRFIYFVLLFYFIYCVLSVVCFIYCSILFIDFVSLLIFFIFFFVSAVRGINIVKFVGACFDTRPCLIMEYCSRRSLYDLLNESTVEFRWAELLRYATEMVCLLFGFVLFISVCFVILTLLVLLSCL
jgi:hypothetical protein